MLNAPAPPGTAAVPPENVAELQQRLLDLADAGLTADKYFRCLADHCDRGPAPD